MKKKPFFIKKRFENDPAVIYNKFGKIDYKINDKLQNMSNINSKINSYIIY